MSQSVGAFDWDKLREDFLARLPEWQREFWRTTPHPDWLADCCGDSPVLSLAPAEEDK